jgi:hypothetical protein
MRVSPVPLLVSAIANAIRLTGPGVRYDQRRCAEARSAKMLFST